MEEMEEMRNISFNVLSRFGKNLNMYLFIYLITLTAVEFNFFYFNILNLYTS